MTDPTDAVITALRSDDRLTVYEAEVPDNPAFPYVVVYPDPGLDSRSSLVAVSDRTESVIQLTAVGLSPAQARLAGKAAKALLVDEALYIPGRTVNPVTQEASRPIRREDSVNPHTFYAVALYRVVSVPG